MSAKLDVRVYPDNSVVVQFEPIVIPPKSQFAREIDKPVVLGWNKQKQLAVANPEAFNKKISRIRHYVENHRDEMRFLPDSYKTSPCRSALFGEECRYGDLCNFGHTVEVVYASHSDKYKTKPCEQIDCKFGKNCVYLHPGDLRRRTIQVGSETQTTWSIYDPRKQ